MMNQTTFFTVFVPMPETLEKGQVISFEDGPAKITSINKVEWHGRFTVKITGRCKKVND